jgi:hypothetical protein
MNAADLATEGLLSQEIESLAGCIARGQDPDTYQDIVEKVRGHVFKLSPERREFWAEQIKTLGVSLTLSLKKGKAGTSYAGADRGQSNPNGDSRS